MAAKEAGIEELGCAKAQALKRLTREIAQVGDTPKTLQAVVMMVRCKPVLAAVVIASDGAHAARFA